ncbi:MAG: hypothetical protein K6C94_04825 [Candidatus Gastranaerophilales bacterium]|nr:hypothetical protein [Candidatus Gastranaerophilales bacterium]
MDFSKLNLFKKFKDTMPIGLSSLGLKRKPKARKQIRNKNGYPNFFVFDRVAPVTN